MGRVQHCCQIAANFDAELAFLGRERDRVDEPADCLGRRRPLVFIAASKGDGELFERPYTRQELQAGLHLHDRDEY